MISLVSLTACFVPEGDALSVDVVTQALESDNRLSVNRLSVNRLSVNHLSDHRMSVNRLSVNQLQLDTWSSNGIEMTAAGREVLEYVAKCALLDGDFLVFVQGGVVYAFPGLFGLAPDWEDRAINTTEKQAVSSCLLAHVNHFGVSVPISARVDGLADVSADEMDRFENYEGSFFGNLFLEEEEMYACSATAAPDFTVSYPNHDLSVGDRLLRRCTDEDPDNPGFTMCGFTHLGDCSDYCETTVGGSYRDCWTDFAHTDQLFTETMSVWLLDGQDPDAAINKVYDAAYGM